LVRYVDWAGERILDHFDAPEDLLRAWADPRSRADVVTFLGQSHLDPVRLTEELGRAGARRWTPSTTCSTSHGSCRR